MPARASRSIQEGHFQADEVKFPKDGNRQSDRIQKQQQETGAQAPAGLLNFPNPAR